jgi:hypothetical protein
MKVIIESYDKKEKIKDKHKLKEFNKYINTIEQVKVIDYNFGEFLNFSYYAIKPDVLHLHKIRPETVFKTNFIFICNQLKKQFSNINIDVEFEVPSEAGKKYKTHSYIHDVLLRITNNNDTYEIGFEYNEIGHSSNISQDNIKNIYSTMCLDSYNVYYEKDNNYCVFMNNIIYEVLVTICSLNQSKYILAKILYLKNNKETDDSEGIDLLLEWKKNEMVSLKDLFEALNPKYIDSDDCEVYYDYEGYKKHLIDDLDIKLYNEYCNFSNIIDILCQDANHNNSRYIMLNRTFSIAMNKLLEASDEIIKLNNKMNRKKDLMQPFIEDIIKNLHRYPNNSIAMMGIDNYLRERGHTNFSNVDIINIFDISTTKKTIKDVEPNTNTNNIRKNIKENKEIITKIIKKYQKTTILKKITDESRIKIALFLNKTFENDKNNVIIDINNKRKIQKIFCGWEKKKYHNAEERKFVFDLLEKILAV